MFESFEFCHSSVLEDSFLLGYDEALAAQTLKMKALCAFGMWGIDNPVTSCQCCNSIFLVHMVFICLVCIVVSCFVCFVVSGIVCFVVSCLVFIVVVVLYVLLLVVLCLLLLVVLCVLL